jgi:hypothetical protein
MHPQSRPVIGERAARSPSVESKGDAIALLILSFQVIQQLSLGVMAQRNDYHSRLLWGEVITSCFPARERFPGGWKTVKPYLRVVDQPKMPHEAA